METKEKKVEITLSINNVSRQVRVNPEESLLIALRRYGYYSVKNGCDDGSCGVCTVLRDGKPIRSCKTRAVDVEGSEITTLEGLTEGEQIHPIQQAFIDASAIQCGYCTPAQILSAKALLDENPDPTDDEIRKALNPVLCRCTGYVRVVEAVHRSSELLRGEKAESFAFYELDLPGEDQEINLPEEYYRKEGGREPLPPIVYTPEDMEKTRVVGKPEVKVDAKKLAQGRAVFTDDIQMEGMLYGSLLTSPHAHARIRKIDTSKAMALTGVQAVLTHQDIERVKFASGGQSYPQPLPYDQVSLDDVVRHVGDRVAIVAAETPEIAQKALELIEVKYEVLPAIVDPEQAMQPGAPVIHAEDDTEGIYDAQKNIVHHIEAEVGDADKAFEEADHIFQGSYRTPKQQQVHLEPHVCISYLDEDGRLTLRTSTQVPFHLRRMLSPLIGLPVKNIRVIKPRIGGGFGNKQELILEDLCSHLTLKTKRPVRMEYTRTQEFTSSRSRHANIINYKIGVKGNQVTAASLYLIGDTGAYGTHALTVNMVGGFKGLTLYNAPDSRFVSDVVYTNTPPAGAFRGYGAMQCQFGIEVLMEEIAENLGVDVVEFKRGNWLKVGESMHLSQALGEGREGTEQILFTSALDYCVDIGIKATDFYSKREKHLLQDGRYRKGIGFSVMMHGSGIADIDMASATIKMNDDGSFNLLMGATDLGTGSDTILAQIAAEVLNVPLDDIIVYSSDTDFTPFDKGAYASSTTYISGEAVRKTAIAVRDQILDHAARMFDFPDQEELTLEYQSVKAPDGRALSFSEIALSSLHQLDQHQIIASASHTSPLSPPPTAAQFAEITVDTEGGKIKVDRLLMVVDCGRVINPATAAGQVEGGMAQALGFALEEEMLFDENGHPLNPNLKEYRIPRADEMPAMDVIFVQTNELSGPFGAKSVSEISIDGVAPAVASAVHDATGIWMRELPYTPERVRKALGK
ncbi:MAG TPA: 2Fe-2S iron-sulfur cluster binding domain-containing protein [Chloroflexi bacterium]|nr:2Fe-2S iron-sulfur cluster binding domain-containing protein [Chloroflexota bacterium]